MVAPKAAGARRWCGRFGHIALGALLLGACAAPEWARVPTLIERSLGLAPVDWVDWYQRRLRLEQRSGWQASGRISVQSGEEAWSGVLTWLQTGDAYRVEWFGPLGTRYLLLQGGPGRVTLTDVDGAQIHDSSAQRLLSRHAGWDLPLGGLRYWALALPQPGRSTQQVFDAAGRLEELRQDGWRIHYQEYQTTQDILLPRRVLLEHPANGRLRVKLLFNQWRLDAPLSAGQ